MKSKILTSLLLTLFLVGIVSAVSFSVSTTSISMTPSSVNQSFTITNTNSTSPITVVVPSTFTLGDNTFNIASSGNVAIPASSSKTFSITSLSDDFSDLSLESTNSSKILVYEQSNSANNQTITVNFQNSFCLAGDVSDSNSKIAVDFDITNKGSFGEEDEWYPFEEIEVEVTLENTGNEDVDDVVVSWGLYNKRTGEWIVDDEEKKVDVNEDDEEIVTFSFTLNPEDLVEADSEDDFVLYVKAYSDDVGEDVQCDSAKQSVSIMRDEDFVMVDPEVTMPSEVQCSEPVEARINVWNIGDNAEDNVYVIATNKELGLNKRLEAGDLDVLEDKKVSFQFDVPQNATEKTYNIEFKVYDEDDEVFENDNNDLSSVTVQLKVAGACEAQKAVDLSSSLSSEAVAGKELTIKSTLRNTGSASTTYQVIVNGYDSWATLTNIEPRSVILAAGESKDVTITLMPNKDASGDKMLTVQALYNGLITEQKVTVPITAKPGFSLTGFSVSNLFGGNMFIWIVAALNVILVVLIIVIAVRIARK